MFANARRGSAGTSASHLRDAVGAVMHTIGFSAEKSSAASPIKGGGNSMDLGMGAAFGSHGGIADAPVTDRLDVAQMSLRAVLGAPIAALFSEDEARAHADHVAALRRATAEEAMGMAPIDPLRHVRALRRVFAERSQAALRITVPRDVVGSLDGFVPFVLDQSRFHKGRMAAAEAAQQRSRGGNSIGRVGPLDDEAALIERLQDWLELFYPENGASTLPFPTLIAAVDGFFAYQTGGIDTAVPLGPLRPYHGVDMPAREEELVLYRVLYHWLAETAVPSGAARAALDCGTRSGLVAALLVKANVSTVVASDESAVALQCLQDNMKRLNRRKAIKRKAVFTLQSTDLMPLGPSATESNGASSAAAGPSSANPFLAAATRRRLAGRDPIMNIAGAAPEPDPFADSGDALLSGAGPRSFDLITYHRPVPHLFDHPMQSHSARLFAHSAADAQLDRVLSLLEGSPKHEGVLSSGYGSKGGKSASSSSAPHVAIISSNYHELLASSGNSSSLEETLAHTIHSRADRQFAKTSLSSSSPSMRRIAGWDIVKRETRPLAALGEQYFGGGGGGNNGGGIFKALLKNGAEGYAAHREAEAFYGRLRHEMLILQPRAVGSSAAESKYFGGIDGSSSSSSSQRARRSSPTRQCVDHLATNSIIDWEDTYEYNHYLPKDGTGNPLHITSAVDSFSYLSDDYYGGDGGGGAAADAGDDASSPHLSALARGAGANTFYNSDPADVFGRLPRPNLPLVEAARARAAAAAERRTLKYHKPGAAAASDAFVAGTAARRGFGGAEDWAAKSDSEASAADGSSAASRKGVNRATGTTPMFDLVFNKEMRLQRRGKWRKLGFDSGERQRYYLDKKVVESQAARLQMLNEIDNFNFRDPSKY